MLFLHRLSVGIIILEAMYIYIYVNIYGLKLGFI